MTRKTSNEQPYTWEEIWAFTPQERDAFFATYGDLGKIAYQASFQLDCKYTSCRLPRYGEFCNYGSTCPMDNVSKYRVDRTIFCHQDAMPAYRKYLREHAAELLAKGWIVEVPE